MLKALAILLVIAAQNQSASEVPAGIRFKPAEAELNDYARGMLEVAFGAKGKRFGEQALYGDVVMCGPLLWKRVQATGLVTTPAKGRTIFTMTGPDGKPAALEGRRFFQNDVGEFQKALDSFVPAGSYSVRFPSQVELKYYWSIIPYDVDAPIFTVEGEGRRFLIDFHGSDHAFLIEDVSSVRAKP